MGSSINFADYGHGGWKVVVVAVLLIVMQFLMVTGRYISRRIRKASLASDDYVLFLATVFTLGLCALALACKHNPYPTKVSNILILSLQSQE